MVKALILCGGADQDGVTQYMCMTASAILESKGYEVEQFILSDMDVGHCTDCGECYTGECIIQDDMLRINSSFAESDLLILATPIHFSGPSSIIKTAIDRFQPYWQTKSEKHPSQCIAMMCGGSPNPNFEITEKIFRAFSITIGMDFKGSFTCPSTDNGTIPSFEEMQEFFEPITADMV